MNYSEQCGRCGTVITAYMWHLDNRLVWLATLVLDYYNQHHRPMPLRAVSDRVTPVEYGCYSRIKHFGLLKHDDAHDAWWPTKTLIKFLKGEIQIPDKVLTLKNQVLALDHPAWQYRSPKPKMVDIHRVSKCRKWKERTDYRLEKYFSSHTPV